MAKIAEDALPGAEERFSGLFTAAPSGIAVCTLQGRILQANPALCGMLGYTEAELRARDCASVTHPEDLALHLKMQGELLAGERQDFVMEKRCIRNGGDVIWTRHGASAIRGRDEHVPTMLVIAEDITERKRAESRYRRLIDSNAQSVIFWNTDGDITHANDSFLRLTGYTREDLLAGNINWARMTPAYYAHLDQRALKEAALNGICGFYEKEWIRKDGSRVPVLLGGATFEDNPSEGVCFALDLTERVKTEALRAGERRFKALFDQGAVGVARVDALTGRYLQVNQRFVEILDRSPEELAQLTAAEITHPHTVGRDLELVRQVKAGALREFSVEKRYLRKDGSDVWVTVTVAEMWAQGEAPDFYLAIVQDISTRKKLEDQFRQAQKMEAMGALAGGIAHDFNNIIASINGYVALAQMKLSGNPDVRDHLGAILTAGHRAAALVQQILAFSRQEHIERFPISLLPAAAESIKMLRATIPATIEFLTSLDSEAPQVLADATQISQVLMNLGINAWHAMQDRPGRIEFRLERCDVDVAHAATQARLRPGVYARLSVYDTGCGMEKSTVQRIFEPFFTTKAPGEGTGLGLAVVHGIMESHDGAVVVYSQPGEGTVFHLYFPAYAAEEEAAVAAAQHGPPPRGHGERILFVEDEDLLVRIGREMLAGLGYTVEAVADPHAALELFSAQPSQFALVITDQTMPGMTGLGLAARLRQIRPSIPIILMTGYSGSLMPERIEAAGVGQLLLKPYTLQALATAAHTALSA